MPAYRLLAKLIVYYAALTAVIATILWLSPGLQDYLPIGQARVLIAETDGVEAFGRAATGTAHPGTFAASMVWLVAAVIGALLAALPVSWVYMEIRNPADYDQSLIDTIVVLPLIVTTIVVVVQNSLALAFSLAGIAGAARYRNSLKSSGDLLFILLAIGLGLAVGIGALELALVSSAMFNMVFVVLWSSNYGERKDMKRFLSDFEHLDAAAAAGGPTATVTTTTSTAVVAEITETTTEPRPSLGRDS